MSDTEKALSWILKGGLLLTPLIVFIVTRSLFFPFITGKNFAFRILVEALGVIWLWAALYFPSFRLRTSPLLWAALAFMAVMGLATAAAPDSYKAFWSDFERMEGYLGLLHLFLYFLMLGAVFRSERDWRLFFHVSLAASVLVALYAALQLAGLFTIHQGGTRVDATLGNATYLAAYLVFHLFFLVWFFLRADRRWLRIAYGLAFFFEIVILYFTATRGAIIGFLGGLAVLSALFALFGRAVRRRVALASLGIVVLIPLSFFLLRDTAIIKKSDLLVRFAAISPSETTTRARFTIWRMALEGWQERPILGWGQESFTYVFSRYYEPSLWRQEPWFDRAHNVFLDWLISGGILGLAAYLGMFAAAGWSLLRALRAGALDMTAFGVLASLLAAHSFQNVFVFDNLTSYVLFFGTLGYVHAVSVGAAGAEAPAAVAPPRRRRRAIAPGAAMGVMALAVAAWALVLWAANIKPIRAAQATLNALAILQAHPPAGRVDAAMAEFGRGITLGTFGTTELREQLAQASGPVVRDPALAPQDKMKFLEFATRELEEQRRAFPSDMRAKAFLATLYLAGGRVGDTIVMVNEALALNDRRPQFYFIAAEAYLNSNQLDQALAVLRRAYELDPAYPEARANLITVLILAGREDEAEEFRLSTNTTAEPRYAQALAQRGKWDRALAIWKEIVEHEPRSPENRANLGLAYVQVGRRTDAVRELREAARLQPSFAPQAEELIRQIQGGRPR